MAAGGSPGTPRAPGAGCLRLGAAILARPLEHLEVAVFGSKVAHVLGIPPASRSDEFAGLAGVCVAHGLQEGGARRSQLVQLAWTWNLLLNDAVEDVGVLVEDAVEDVGVVQKEVLAWGFAGAPGFANAPLPLRARTSWALSAPVHFLLFGSSSAAAARKRKRDLYWFFF